ncbi:MAG: hypothetical protein GXY06_04325 [Clostridiaceae bacterium]|nr:hypothetical protein [Clostridiaceae bacterium]
MRLFSSLIGQKRAKERIYHLLDNDLARTYLLTGPKGIGKRSMAMQMSRMLLCDNPSSEGACGVCGPCHYIEQGTHPDFICLYPESGDKSVKVATVRNRVISDLRMYPQISKRKVYLIDGDALGEEGQNALLKSLEEPPDFSYFILTVSEAERLQKTVLSRAVTVPLNRYTENEVVEILKASFDISSSDAALFARLSNGVPGVAIEMSKNNDLLEMKDELENILLRLDQTSDSEILTSDFSFFDANKSDIDQVLSLLMSFLGQFPSLMNPAHTEDLQSPYKTDMMKRMIKTTGLTPDRLMRASESVVLASKALALNCSFEPTIARMLMTLKKEFTNAQSS